MQGDSWMCTVKPLPQEGYLHPLPHTLPIFFLLVVRTCKIYSLSIQYAIGNYNHHAVCYMPRTYSS